MAEQTLKDSDAGGELASGDLREKIDHWVQVIDRWVQHIDQGMGGTAEGADPELTLDRGPEAALDAPRLESA